MYGPIRYAAFLIVVTFVFCTAAPQCFGQEPAWWTKQKKDCGLPANLAYNSWDGRCPSQSQNMGGTTDNGEAERQRKQQIESERQRQETEKKRLADEAKAKKDADERQKAFEKTRDEALKTLKGSGSPTDLRGDAKNDGLRGSTPVNGGVSETAAKPAPTRPYEKVVIDAFPNTSADVTDRIRKGFQAIETLDWKVAKAWFQDALNREPANVGIKRLVALCDYTITKPAPPPTKMPEPSNAMTDADRAAWYEDFKAKQDKILQEQIQQNLNEFYLNEVYKHPELRIRVIKKPAAAKPPMTLELFREKLLEFLNIPKPKRVTAVIAVKG